MMKYSILFLLLLFSVTVFASDMWTDDPSAVALQEVFGEEKSGIERYRILADFNGDGIEDMALSEELNSFGNGGGFFTLYVRNMEDKYREIGVFQAHPYADTIALEKWNHQVRLWTFTHSGGGSGALHCREVSDKGLLPAGNIEIHPGDSGTNLGNAIFQSIFKHFDIPVKIERSITTNGRIEWKSP